MTRKKTEWAQSLAVAAREKKVLTRLQATNHAIQRFLERGGAQFTRDTGPFLIRLVYASMRVKEARERVWDTTVLKPVLLLRLLQPHRVHNMDVISVQPSDMVALIREGTIVTVLTLAMAARNKEAGMYFKPDKTPFLQGVTT